MFDLKTYLVQRRGLIDGVLEAQLPAATVRPTTLHEAMRYSVFSGGKRLRPILCLAAAEAAGATAECALLPACAVEILHTYTLVHDDLPCMDDDDMRRGRPTAHRIYGEANAILAGDALQALAFEVVSRTEVPAPYSVADLLGELARAAGSQGVVGGQVADIAAGDGTADQATVEFVHLHKTADLFRVSMRLGAMAAGANADVLNMLTQFGVHLGLAFQITDDLLDAGDESSAEDVNELSCLSICSAKEAYEQAAALLTVARGLLEGLARQGFQPLVALADFVLTRDH